MRKLQGTKSVTSGKSHEKRWTTKLILCEFCSPSLRKECVKKPSAGRKRCGIHEARKLLIYGQNKDDFGSNPGHNALMMRKSQGIFKGSRGHCVRVPQVTVPLVAPCT